MEPPKQRTATYRLIIQQTDAQTSKISPTAGNAPACQTPPDDLLPSLLSMSKSPTESFDAWKIFTKAKDALQDGVRLENISWRLYHMNIAVARPAGPPKSIFQSKAANQAASIASKSSSASVAQPVAPSLPINISKDSHSHVSSLSKDMRSFYDNSQNMHFTASLSATQESGAKSAFASQSIGNDLDLYSHSLGNYTSPFGKSVKKEDRVVLPQSNHSIGSFNLRGQCPSDMSRKSPAPLLQTGFTPSSTLEVSQSCPPTSPAGLLELITVCHNCETSNTPLWRRNLEGLFYKLHGSSRPLHMKTNVIRKRNRPKKKESQQMETEKQRKAAVSKPVKEEYQAVGKRGRRGSDQGIPYEGNAQQTTMYQPSTEQTEVSIPMVRPQSDDTQQIGETFAGWGMPSTSNLTSNTPFPPRIMPYPFEFQHTHNFPQSFHQPPGLYPDGMSFHNPWLTKDLPIANIKNENVGAPQAQYSDMPLDAGLYSFDDTFNFNVHK